MPFTLRKEEGKQFITAIWRDNISDNETEKGHLATWRRWERKKEEKMKEVMSFHCCI